MFQHYGAVKKEELGSIPFHIAICHLVFGCPPASLASRHVEDLFSPLGLCSQVASVRCRPPLSELINSTGVLTGLDSPLAALYRLA